MGVENTETTPDESKKKETKKKKTPEIIRPEQDERVLKAFLNNASAGFGYAAGASIFVGLAYGLRSLGNKMFGLPETGEED